MKRRKNKIGFLLLLGFLFIFLSGCTQTTQIEDRDFILAVGIGFENGRYKVTYARPDLHALTGQSVGKNEKFVMTYTGDTISDIEEDYASNSDKRLDLRHLKIIVLDSRIVENKDKLQELLGFISNKYEISRNTLVFYTQSQAEKLLNVDTINENIGENVEQLYENNPQNSDVKKVTIGDLINGSYQVEKVVLIPILEIKKDRIWLSGAGVFWENEYIDSIDEKQLMYFHMMNGMGKGRDVVLENSQIIKIKEIQSKFSYSIQDKKPYVAIKIKGVGEELQNNIEGDSRKVFNKQVRRKMLNLNQRIIKKEGLDVLNLYRKTAYKNQVLWKKYQGKPEQFMNDLTIDITVDFKLQ